MRARDVVVARQGVLQAFQHQQPHRLAANIAVGAGVKGLASPSGDSIRALQRLTRESGDIIKFTPPASATSLSRLRRLTIARCTAAKEEEHAVSRATEGPRAPRR